ncbi:acetylglutamate kinase [Paenibacillus thailandensis]
MVKLNQNLRVLWEQHVYWTRKAMTSIVAGLPDEQETLKRLLRNPADFAAALRPFYGPNVANRFASLFTDHLTIAAELIRALKSGNSAAAADARKRWFANADDIAVFLSRINPYWPEAEWKKMLYEHLNLLARAVSARLSGNHALYVELGDPIELQALGMADMMTAGIVRQFPNAFIA